MIKIKHTQKKNVSAKTYISSFALDLPKTHFQKGIALLSKEGFAIDLSFVRFFFVCFFFC